MLYFELDSRETTKGLLLLCFVVHFRIILKTVGVFQIYVSLFPLWRRPVEFELVNVADCIS